MHKAVKRVKGRKKIDGFVDPKTGLQITLHLYQDTMEVEAHVLGQAFRRDTVKEAKEAALAYALSTVSLEFQPIIVIGSTCRPQYQSEDGFVGISLRRVWVARRGDNSLVKIEWDKYDRENDALNLAHLGKPHVNSQFRYNFTTLPCKYKPPRTFYYGQDRDIFLVEYSYELWKALQRLQCVLVLMREKLDVEFQDPSLSADLLDALSQRVANAL